MEQVTLYNGVKMPIIGYGVYQVSKKNVNAVSWMHLPLVIAQSTPAQSYFNEEQVGSAIVKSGVPREDIFLTTKVWLEHYGYDAARKSVLESMQN